MSFSIEESLEDFNFELIKKAIIAHVIYFGPKFYSFLSIYGAALSVVNFKILSREDIIGSKAKLFFDNVINYRVSDPFDERYFFDGAGYSIRSVFNGILKKITEEDEIDAADAKFIDVLDSVQNLMKSGTDNDYKIYHVVSTLMSCGYSIMIREWISSSPEFYKKWQQGKLYSSEETFLNSASGRNKFKIFFLEISKKFSEIEKITINLNIENDMILNYDQKNILNDIKKDLDKRFFLPYSDI